MTMFYGAIEDVKRRFAPTGKFLNAGRWVNPVLGLGALVLTGYLMIGHLATPAATTPAPHSEAQLAQATAQVALSSETGNVTHSSVTRDESIRSSMSDVLNAALGTVLAAAWLMGGAWVGIRSARISTPLSETAYQTRSAHRLQFTASSDLLGHVGRDPPRAAISTGEDK
jgi:hypothetical protein